MAKAFTLWKALGSDQLVSKALGPTLLLATVNFLKSSGALMSNGRPYHPPKMPSIPSEIDITDISDEAEPDWLTTYIPFAT